VQEVNAVTMAVDALHPDVRSVIELGGQDAKIILFQPNEQTGDTRVVASMNDKGASGTGATIDKCLIKAGVDPDERLGPRAKTR
jgi:activator of 2-hydroxyglutaryl-CoA dehydratase